MQSKKRSALEALVNIGAGLILSVLLNYFILRIEGHDVSWGGMGALAVVMTIASFARQYILRRIFNGWDT